MIQLQDVVKTYPGFRLDATLQIEPGTITGLIGVNGSGKSTLFRLILGLEKADGGSIRVFEQDIDSLNPTQKARIGVVFPDSGFNGTLNAKGIGKILGAFYPDFSNKEYLELCKTLKIKMDQSLESMSTGQRVRLKLAAAISHHPDLLILDEPTSGLDVLARHELMEILQTYMETPGRSILISSHIASDIEELCDDVYLIQKGQLRLHEEIGTILDEYGLLHLDAGQAGQVDLRGVIRMMPFAGGVKVLVKDRQYYQENYPELVLDRAGLDDLIELFEKGQPEDTK
ncbi:ABC transporter ATP-binding protein [Erysipelotrichaceae bacterium 51-3]